MSITGKVVSGRRLASDMLAPIHEALHDWLGAAPVPGTLNLLLVEPVILAPDKAVISEGIHHFWPAAVNGTPCLLHRWTTCPLHVVEIVAACHLRSAFRLEDGDRLTIDLPIDSITPTTTLHRLSWWLVWRMAPNFYRGRRKHPLLQRLLLMTIARPVHRFTQQPAPSAGASRRGKDKC